MSRRISDELPIFIDYGFINQDERRQTQEVIDLTDDNDVELDTEVRPVSTPRLRYLIVTSSSSPPPRPPQDQRDYSSIMDIYGDGYWARRRAIEAERQKEQQMEMMKQMAKPIDVSSDQQEILDKPSPTQISALSRRRIAKKNAKKAGQSTQKESSSVSETTGIIPSTPNSVPSPSDPIISSHPSSSTTTSSSTSTTTTTTPSPLSSISTSLSPPSIEEKSSLFKNFICPICLDQVTDVTSTLCGHIFCESCILDAIKHSSRCPSCRCKLSTKEIHPLFMP